VLLPGESAAPGTVSGKDGSPQAQTTGVPFDVRIRACDSDWQTVSSVGNFIHLSSTDGTAALPSDFSLIAGEMTVSATVNAAGTFLVSADDLSDTSIPIADSSPFVVYRLQRFEFARINQKNQYAGVPMEITVGAVDPTGNLVSGFSGAVRLREITSFGEGRIEPSLITLTNGQWSGMVTNYRADETSISRGNVNILAELESDPSLDGLSDPFVVHPGSHSRVQLVVPGESPAPGSLAGVIGNPGTQASGQDFVVSVFATDDYCEGYVELLVNFGTAGTQTLSVADQTNGAIQGMTSPPIFVTAAGAHHFQIDPISGPITAGTAVPVSIRAVDAGDNLVEEFSGDATLSANTGAGSIEPGLVTFANGVWSGAVTFRGAGGAISLTCSDFSSPPHTGTSDPFEVLPGAYSGLQLILPGESPRGGTLDGIEGVPDEQSAGTGFDIRVRAVDAWWNLVPGTDLTLDLTSSDPFATGTGSVPLINGESVLPVALFAAGTQHFSVVDGESSAIPMGISRPISVTPGSYSRIVLVLPGENIAPGSDDGSDGTALDQSINFAFTAEVHATDAWWNPVEGITDVIRMSATDPLAELPPDTALENGWARVPVRLATGGFQQITASNLSQPSMPTSTSQLRAITSGFHLEAQINPTDVDAGGLFTLNVEVVNDAGAVIEEINSTV
jgi:hypothetical protein